MLYVLACGVVAAVLAAYWLLLDFVGQMIDYAWRASPRADGGERTGAPKL